MSGTSSDKTGGESRSRNDAADEVRRAFSALPFDQQISTLIRIELDMVGDAVGTVVSAVSSAIDEVAKACDFSEQPGSAASGTSGHTATT